MAIFRVQLGRSTKNQFICTFDKNDHQSVIGMLRKYFDFYLGYRDSHSISARMWNWPTVYVDNVPFGKACPNGTIDTQGVSIAEAVIPALRK